MKKMKSLLSILLGASMLLSLVACGDKTVENNAEEADATVKAEASDSSDATQDDAATESGEGDVFHLMFQGSTTINESTTDVAKAEIEFYNSLAEKYPDVDFVIEGVAPADYETKLKAYAVSGEIPDFFNTKAGLLPDLIEADLVHPLNDILEADPEWKDTLVESMLGEYTYDGIICGIPGVGGGNGVLYYRQSMLQEIGYEEPPADWDGFIEMCQKLIDNGVIPLANDNASKSPVPSCMWNTLAYRFVDGEWYNKVKAYEEGASFTDPEVKESVEHLMQLFEMGAVNSDYQSLGSDASLQLIYSGEAAMAITGYWQVGNMETAAANDESGEIQKVIDDLKITRIPCPAGYEENANNFAASSGWGWSIGNQASEREVEIAVDIMRWRTSQELVSVQLENANIPIVKYEEMGIEYDESKVSRLWGDYLEFFNESTIIPVWDCELSPAFQEAEYNGMAEVLAGNLTVDEFLSNLQAAHESAKPQ